MDYLSVHDARRIVRLLGEVAVLETDLPGKRRFLMQGLSKLVHADFWYWSHFKDQAQGNVPTMFMFVDGGWTGEIQRIKVAEGTTSTAMCSINETCRKLVRGHFTRRLAELLPRGQWSSCDLVRQFLQPVGIGDCFISIYPLGRSIYSSMNFMRTLDGPPFSPRDICIAHLITDEIDWLHREGTDVPAAEHVNKLSTRQRQVLFQLLSGDSVKQIARKLSISNFTVNDHLKNIYRRFGVSGRGELLAQFLAGGQTGPSDAPPPI
jgi:DNA-binding CsgD family transcriptional regulator